MMHVVAGVTAKPGRRASVLGAFHANVPHVRAEAGCIEYGAAIEAERAPRFRTPIGPDDVFMVIEKWESLEALSARARAPHMAAYGEKVKDLLERRVIHVLTEG